MRLPPRRWIVLVFCLGILGPVLCEARKQATFTVDVPPRRWKALNVQNLPKDTQVAVQVLTTGEVAVAFVSKTAYQRRPTAVRPLFHSRVDKQLSFTVTIPETDDYLVIFDNRTSRAARAITVTVQAIPADTAPTTQQMHGEFERQMRQFERHLSQIFVFESFPIQARQCGTPQAFSNAAGIVLCQEFAAKLLTTLGDQVKAGNALLFALFHELGHVLLRQWHYPFFDNEDVADEFATVLLVMLGQQEQALAGAEFLAANPSMLEAIAKVFKDDRHALSTQRARNILRWLRDPKLVHKWQKILLPQMQTAMLAQLQQHPPVWVDRALLAQELENRP